MAQQSNSSTVIEQTKNAAVASGLREIADFLDAHPELPEFGGIVWSSGFRLGAAEKARARDELAAVAAALGDRATEELRGDYVRISARFGPVGLQAEARVADLGGDAPVQPRYEAIIAQEAAVTA